MLFKKFIQEGDTVIDVGANIGFYTLLFSSLAGKKGKVLAFEPDEKNFYHLKSNTFPYPNVQLLDFAVSNKESETFFYRSERYNVDHRLYPDTYNREKVTVRTCTLGTFLRNETSCFIKLDIQGYEIYALEGMQDELNRIPHLAVFAEFWPYGLSRAGTDPVRILDFFSGINGKLFWFCKNRLIPLPDPHFENFARNIKEKSYSNLLFLKGKYVEKISC